MATHTIKTIWRKDNIFDTDVDGHTITIDLGKEDGGEDAGPRPKKLLLVAAAGCSGLDVVPLLKKMRVELKGFDIQIEAQMSEEHPKQYTSMKVIYEFEGDNLPMEKLEKAVTLSYEKYCGVMAMYKKAIPISWEIRIKS
ncbi:MAG TPA: OsmC family protein [Paludibacteraceae bacterium]|jgi:putative redox protein|nr:OsmC family protein [Paludibacteraceae bacterium]MDS1031119.1 OsmC family protein [Porphyromonadaceae sp. NP-X]NLJ19915.1 OsmC family protein [Bacteroidales bacterium]HOH55065.1 OsmC family protein [Paludibacteraceae bacterium]